MKSKYLFQGIVLFAIFSILIFTCCGLLSDSTNEVEMTENTSVTDDTNSAQVEDLVVKSN